jgi:hypothetical protein
MSHQPFETWILDPAGMTLEDRRALHQHVESCSQCQRLSHRWDAVSQELRLRRMVAPMAGFTQRWQAGLAERRANEQRRQAWKIFGILTGAALFILLVMAGYLMATSTPADWLVAVVRTAASSLKLFDLVYYVVQTWLSSTPLALNIAVWLYLTITLCGLCLVWGGILWWTKSGSNVGVFNK